MSGNKKTVIIGFPSTGLVGAFAVSYLVKALDMQNIGELESQDIPPSVFIQDGKVYGPFQIYNKDNVYVILSNVLLSPKSTHDFIQSGLEYAKKVNADHVIIPRGMTIMGPQEDKPKTFGLTVTDESKNLLDEFKLPIISEASVVGADAGAISALKKSSIPSVILYTICNMKFPDSDAIVKAVETMANIIGVKVDTSKFEQRLDKISKDNERLIEQTRKMYEKPSEKPPSMPSPGIG
ncbi:MAG: PAC2 family protein [Nitrosopumilaceae archaeon]|nr:PAC2 family protein [Nitrosopumilaceae archaeon]